MSADKDARIAELERKLAEQQAALDWFFTLVSESKGVAGYHLNGALAEWDEFELPQSGTSPPARPAQSRDGVIVN